MAKVDIQGGRGRKQQFFKNGIFSPHFRNMIEQYNRDMTFTVPFTWKLSKLTKLFKTLNATLNIV
jgi:hypothetical protein